MSKPIEHERPAYYGGPDNPYEVWKVLEAWGFQDNAYRFTALVYLARAGKKPGNSTTKDLKKALAYIEREIQDIEKRGEPEKWNNPTLVTDILNAATKAHGKRVFTSARDIESFIYEAKEDYQRVCRNLDEERAEVHKVRLQLVAAQKAVEETEKQLAAAKAISLSVVQAADSPRCGHRGCEFIRHAEGPHSDGCANGDPDTHENLYPNVGGTPGPSLIPNVPGFKPKA